MIAANDRRHGTHAGYVAGCRDQCCRAARLRAQKQRALYRLATGADCLVPHEDFRAVVDPWLKLGLSPYAIEDAAGIGSRLADILRKRASVLRTTYAAVAALKEDDFADSAKVYADLTRARIDSLMAIGHQLSDMPINAGGHWRTREFVAVGSARLIRDYYAAHEFKIGPDSHTAARARNRGARPPLAWNDPGTLAWPTDERPRTIGRPKAVRGIDHVVVERILAGDRTLHATKAERHEVIRRWLADGRTQGSLERLRPEWNVARDLREMRASEMEEAS